MSRKVCSVCKEVFNTKDHKPLIIPGCPHNVCEVVASKSQFAKCPECKVEYSELLAKDLEVDERLLEYVSSQEIHCCNHPQECAEFFCATHNTAQCFNCQHKPPCNSEDLADNDSCVLLKEAIARVAAECGLNMREVMRTQETLARADEKYRFLTSLLRTQRPIDEMCSVHGMTPAQFLIVEELKPACKKCVEKHPEQYCHLSDPSAKEILEQAMRKYSESLHFYLFPETLLKSLAILPSLDIGFFVQVAHQLVDVRDRKKLERGDQMYCPLCTRPAFDFHRLPCTSAIHAICASCDLNLVGQPQIFCPLDHNNCIRNRNSLKPGFEQWESVDMAECENNPRALPVPGSLPTLKPKATEKNQVALLS